MRTGSPHVVYVVAHGEFDARRAQGVVYLESDRPGGFDAISADELARLVPSHDGPAIVLLDCCWSAARGASAAGRSVARALSAPGRAVVSMQFAWPAASGPIFWNTLFSSFTAPSPLDDCVFEAREALYRNSLDTADWGFPVLLRPGLAPRTPPPIVREPRWGPDLSAIRDHLVGRDRALIDELLARLPEWVERSDIGSWVRRLRLDPLFVLLAGDEDRALAPVTTSPVWFTRLLTPPTRIEWSAHQEGPWWVSVWVTGGEELALCEAREPTLDFAEATSEWPRGVWIRWQVTNEPTRRRHGPALVRGTFQILDSGAAAECRARMKDDMRRQRDRQVGAAAWLLQAGLYETLRVRCARLLARSLSPPVRFVVHRMLAEAYGEMRRQLPLQAMGHPEAHWAAALARRHVESSYRAVPGAGSSMEA